MPASCQWGWCTITSSKCLIGVTVPKRETNVQRSDPTSRRMGAALKAIREEVGLTQREVGTRYGATEGNIAAYEQTRDT